jgi:hypothetical protein
MTETDANLSRSVLVPFGVSAIIWLGTSAWICWHLAPDATAAHRALTWMGILSGICLLDLYALIQALSALFALMALSSSEGSSPSIRPPQSPIFLVIRTSYWGGIKLVCLIFLGTLLARGASPSGIPTVGLITGVSTLVVVPLLGGLLWHLQHHRDD